MFFIAGGTGFIGSHLIQALSKNGLKARCLVRSPEKAGICEESGFETAIGDITDRKSLEGKLDNCDIIVHLVGIIEEKKDVTFEKVHVEGTKNLVDEAKKAGIKHIFYQSAIGASPTSRAKYHKTKAEAEEIVITSGIPYTIFRPSLVAGKGDGLTEKLKEIVHFGPFVPVPGSGNTKFQPIYVEDLVKCFMKIFFSTPPVFPSSSLIYELGGPEHLTYNELITQLMDAMGEKKAVVHVPLIMVKLGLPFVTVFNKSIGNLIGKKIPTATGEQLSLLQLDNICDKDSIEKNFGFAPITYKETLKLIINS